MNTIEIQNDWSIFPETFSRRHKARPTRIGVFEGAPGAVTDYWLEDGLPLEGIDIDARGDEAPPIEIMLGNGRKPEAGAFAHILEKHDLSR